jgi:hypothetical protein
MQQIPGSGVELPVDSPAPVEEVPTGPTTKLVVRTPNVQAFVLGDIIVTNEGTDVPSDKSEEIIAAALAADVHVEVVS